MRRSLFWVLASLSACGYRAGSFEHAFADFEGRHRTVGCLDVAVAPYEDGATDGPAATFSLGNRCDAPVKVDLQVPATVRLADGSATPAAAYDPDGEIEPVLLEGRSVGHEHIEYEPVAETMARPVKLCFDLTHLNADSPSPEPIEVCIDAGARALTAEVHQ